MRMLTHMNVCVIFCVLCECVKLYVNVFILCECVCANMFVHAYLFVCVCECVSVCMYVYMLVSACEYAYVLCESVCMWV